MEKGYNYWYKNEDNFDDDIILASIQKSITNFVKILTNKEIPVSYSSVDGDNYTDGKSISLSSDINSGNLDSVIGLALHEASHCLLSDFSALKTLLNRCLNEEISGEDVPTVKDLVNWIEDRRIDYFVYNNAPGYKVYYHACYDRFFQDPQIDEMLKKENRGEFWDCYMFRIINLLNKNTDLKALKHLKEVYDILDLKNINRLETTKDSIDLAIKIFKFLEPHVQTPPTNEITLNQKYINKILKKQKTFLGGGVKKSSVKGSRKDKINGMSKSKFSTFNLSKKIFKGNNRVVILEDITENLALKTNGFGLFNKICSDKNRMAVDEGINLGKVLVSKLKIRNEEKSLYSNRLKKGKVDPKRLYTAGFLDDIFKKTTLTRLKPVKLHISVDASGSMKHGDKWEKTIKLVSAISYASLKIPNLDVVVSFRTTYLHEGGAGKSQTEKLTPLILLAFDSTKHKIDKINLFKRIGCNGATPEGICIEAILSKIPNTTYKEDSYFLNLSDGMPTFTPFGYKENFAIQHTKDIIGKLKKKGVNVLSYFIEGQNNLNSKGKNNFKEMYGRGSSFIDVSNLNQVTLTLNKLFLKQNT